MAMMTTATPAWALITDSDGIAWLSFDKPGTSTNVLSRDTLVELDSHLRTLRQNPPRGLVIRGPRKIYDTRTTHMGFLYAQRHGDPRAYHDDVFARFWRRELEIEETAAIADALARGGIDPGGFASYLATNGPAELEALQREAEAHGVFGVPSYRVAGELYWGNERLERVRERLAAGA